MNSCSIPYRRFYLTLVVFALLLTITNCVSAKEYVNLEDGFEISVVDDKLDLGQGLEVKLEFKGASMSKSNADVELEVLIDGVSVYVDDEYSVDFVHDNDTTITLSSANFKNDDDENVWDGLLMAYDCGDHDVTVKVGGGDLDDDYEDSDQYTVGGSSAENFGSVQLSPSKPTLNDDMEVSVTDEGDDDYSDKAEVRIVWLSDTSPKDEWNEDDKEFKTPTKSNGKTKTFTIKDQFEKGAYGLYRLDAYDNDPEYCLETIFFNVSNSLLFGDPTPAAPKAGETFKINVSKPDGSPAVGLTVTVSGPQTFTTGRVGADGTVSFAFSAEGTYTLSAGGDGTYDLVTRTVSISEKQTLTVTVDPANQELGKSVEITVKSGSNLISDATLTVVAAGKNPLTLSDKTSQGKLTYTPTESGDYTVKAAKASYTDGTGTFKIQGGLKIELPRADDLRKGSDVLVKVKDGSNNPLQGASVTVEGKSIVGVTDGSGVFKFTVKDVGTHTVVVNKDGYGSARSTLVIGDDLKLGLSVSELELGGSVTLTVTDSSGMLTSADMRITQPDDNTVTETGSTYAYTPEKAGTYLVDVSKQGYSRSTSNFTVNPKLLSISAEFDGDNLVVSASSHSKPVSELPLSIISPSGNKTTLKTDSSGKASYAASLPGNYTVETTSLEYEKKTAAVEKEKALMSDMLLPLIIVLAVLTMLFIIVILIVHFAKSRRGDDKFRPKKGSRLGR